MVNFKKANGPFLRDKTKTEKIMINLIIALLPIIFFSIYKNGVKPYLDGYGTIYDMLYPLIMIIISVSTCVLVETLWARFILKEGNIINYHKNSYSSIPGIFLALILPINTPIYILVLGAIFATLVGKLLFGGFGHNIFNPALTGRLFVIGAYFSKINDLGGYLNLKEVDAISSATPLSNLALNNYIAPFETLVKPFGSLLDFFTGLIPGSMGETSALLIIVGLIFLLVSKTITWHIPITYIMTVFIITAVIGYYYDLGLWYPLFHILSGGLLFGAVFMATDPVTSPTTPTAQILYGISLGILTVIFRFISSYPEGVLTSILTMNILVVIYDKIGSRGRVDAKKLIIPTIAIFSAAILSTILIINTLKPDDETVIEDPDFTVLETSEQNSIYTYKVENKGFHGNITANIQIENNMIINIEILEQKESVWNSISSNSFLDNIIKNQSDLNNLDTVSGATFTSNYLKDMAEKTINYHKERLNEN